MNLPILSENKMIEDLSWIIFFSFLGNTAGFYIADSSPSWMKFPEVYKGVGCVAGVIVAQSLLGRLKAIDQKLKEKSSTKE